MNQPIPPSHPRPSPPGLDGSWVETGVIAIVAISVTIAIIAIFGGGL